MSHIVFGEMKTGLISEYKREMLKKALLIDGMIIYLNDEIDFSSDVIRMLEENGADINNMIFCITSVSQKFNSEDLLFPYANYSEEELYPNGEDRTVFERVCTTNLQLLNEGLSKIITILGADNLRIFITMGYDDYFRIIKCSQAAMFNDLSKQVIYSFQLESTIYELI